MNNLRKTPENVTSEACQWIARLETGDLSPGDEAAFRAWMQADPRHVAEIKLRLNDVATFLMPTGIAHHPLVCHGRRTPNFQGRVPLQRVHAKPHGGNGTVIKQLHAERM